MLTFLLLAASVITAQATNPFPRFEAATIKPTPPGAPKGSLRPLPGGERYVGVNIPLRLYLMTAYQIKPEQITGGPPWVDSDPYDLNAEAARPSTIQDLHIMLQNLLTERFQLQLHHEPKEMSAYVLSVAKGGPKNLTSHPYAGAGDLHLTQTTEQVERAKWTAHCASMDMFAYQLSLNLDRPVVNQTALAGCFDFDLTFHWEMGYHDGQVVNGVTVDASAPSLFDAFPIELGLQLEPKKTPVDTIVIDHAERPISN